MAVDFYQWAIGNGQQAIGNGQLPNWSLS